MSQVYTSSNLNSFNCHDNNNIYTIPQVKIMYVNCSKLYSEEM